VPFASACHAMPDGSRTASNYTRYEGTAGASVIKERVKRGNKERKRITPGKTRQKASWRAYSSDLE